MKSFLVSLHFMKTKLKSFIKSKDFLLTKMEDELVKVVNLEAAQERVDDAMKTVELDSKKTLPLPRKYHR